MKVGVIDYGVGNLGSVMHMLEELRATPILIDRPVDMHTADCLILPGVGNFANCARLLNINDWVPALGEEVLGYKRPLLGICVGMQLLADSSEEGAEEEGVVGGLGFVHGQVKHLRDLGCSLKLPHVGWNDIDILSTKDRLFEGISKGTDFYFVHSYAFMAEDITDVLATAQYGLPFAAAIHRENIWGVQFHPEKSSRAGFRLMSNFIKECRC